MGKEITLLKPHTHVQITHPPGATLGLDADGLTKAQAQWLVGLGGCVICTCVCGFNRVISLPMKASFTRRQSLIKLIWADQPRLVNRKPFTNSGGGAGTSSKGLQ